MRGILASRSGRVKLNNELRATPILCSIAALADINMAINNVRWVMKAGALVVDKTKGQVR
jgi:hypothetical protein